MDEESDVTSARGAVIVKDAVDIGNVLRGARRSKRMSQQQLADAIGVTRQWVIGAEKGAPTARLDLVLAALRHTDMLVDLVADDSQVEIDSIFGNTDDDRDDDV